ncbi:MAG: hypothetical protein ACI4ON_04385 [Clostridia bacterium]
MKKEDNNYSSENEEELDEIDKILIKKIEEVKVPDSIFNTKKIYERYENEQKRKKNIAKVASIVIIILMVGLALGIHINSNMNTEKIDNIGANNVENDGSTKLEISGNLNIRLKKIILDKPNFDYFYTTQVKEILSYEIIDGIPYTRLKAYVLKDYLYDEEGDVEMIVPGGIFTVKELKDNIEPEYLENIGIENYNDEDKVSVTCYNSIYIPMAEVGKTYLTSLNEQDGELFVCANLKYGFKEYDVETNTIKDIDGNSVPVDIETYLSNNK